MRIWLPVLCALCVTSLEAQSISIASPASGATLSGWTGSSLSASLSSAPSVVEVCYTVDAYPATNPGPPTVISGTSGALLAAGCVNTPPFNFPVNSYWWANGPHQVVATGYDALGAAVATSSAVAFTIANTWPVACSGVAPAFTVTPGTAFTSNWSGMVNLTVTATTCTSDTINLNVFVDGINLSSSQGPALSAGTFTWPLDTTQYTNGPHVIGLTLADSTNGSSGFSNAAGEFTRTVTFANSVVPSYTTSSARRIYVAPAAAYILTPALHNTDQSVAPGTTFAFYSTNTSVATVSWTCCTGATSTTVTGVAQGGAEIWMMPYAQTGTDGTVALSNTIFFHSNSIGNNPAYANQLLVITGGTNCTQGVYLIGAANASNGIFTLQNPTSMTNTSFATSTSAVCSWAIGPARASWAQVNATNPPIAHFLNTGAISTTYVPGHSIVLNELFQSTQEIASQPYPTPYLKSICQSGFNAMETGGFAFDSTSWSSSESTLVTQATSYIASQVQLVNLSHSYCNNLNLWLIGDSIMRNGNDLYATAQGVASARNGSTWTQSGLAHYFQIYNNSNAVAGNTPLIGMTMVDEYAYNFMANQGPITLGGATNTQNWLGSSNSITAASGVCTVSASTSGPGGTWALLQGTNPAGGFTITGSVTSGMNTLIGGAHYIATVSGTGFTFPCESVANGTYNSVNDPTLRINVNGCCTWYTPPGGSSATDYLADDSLGYVAQQIDSIPGRIPAAISIAGNIGPSAAGLAETSCTNGGVNTSACQRQHLTVNGVNEYTVGGAATFDDHYTTHSYVETYLSGRQSVNSTISDLPAANVEMSGKAQTFYGAYDPAKPYETIVSHTSINFAMNATPPSQIPVASCTGNSITFSSPHQVRNIIAGASRLSIAGSSDANCNNNFVILNNPTATTLTVARAATSQTCPGSDTSSTPCAYIQNSCSVSGTAVTLTGGAQWPSWVAGRPISLHFGSNTGTIATWNSGTSLTLTASLGTVSNGSCDVGNGGTVTFQNGDTASLWSISSDAATSPMGFGTTWMNYGNISPASQTQCGGSAVTSQAFVSHRGQTFKVSGVAPGAGDTYFNFAQSGIHFGYDIENLPTPIDSQGNANACWNFIREIPSLNGTGGTASIIYDGSYVQGRNPSNLWQAGGVDPAWVFVNEIDAMILRAAGTRAYKIMQNPVAYSPSIIIATNTKAGWTGAGSSGVVATYNQAGTPNQLFGHPNVESGYSVPDFWAGSVASHIWSRVGKYFLGSTALNSTDYGNGLESGTFQSSSGYLHVVLNATNAQRTRTVTLTPFETAGQNVILWIADGTHGIYPLTIIPAGTTTYNLTLQQAQAAFFLCPTVFAGELQQPTVALNLADGGSNATSIAAQCGYDPYLLPLAAPFSLGSGSGGFLTASLPYDKTVGPLYCTISYLGSSSQVVAGGSNSSVLTF